MQKTGMHDACTSRASPMWHDPHTPPATPMHAACTSPCIPHVAPILRPHAIHMHAIPTSMTRLSSLPEWRIFFAFELLTNQSKGAQSSEPGPDFICGYSPKPVMTRRRGNAKNVSSRCATVCDRYANSHVRRHKPARPGAGPSLSSNNSVPTVAGDEAQGLRLAEPGLARS